jgi:hypothetical protein
MFASYLRDDKINGCYRMCTQYTAGWLLFEEMKMEGL